MTDQIIPTWEQKTLEKLLTDSLREQRRRRRWGIFFKILFFIYALLFLILIWPDDISTPTGKKKVSLVDIKGEISDTGTASAQNISNGLHAAFKDKDTQAVILRINSPGGSPVQASNVYNDMLFLRKKYPKIKLYVVCTDVCASAAYYIAAAGDQIYANPSSLVGSIGVLMDGFGFVDGIHKIGVERRLFTSGGHKGFLDPFSPLKPDEVQNAQVLLDDVHQQFIDSVKQGRGARLKVDPNTFSGLVWTGHQALPLGLIDGYGDARSVARDVIKNDNIVNVTVKQNYFDQLATKLGSSFGGEIATRLGISSEPIR